MAPFGLFGFDLLDSKDIPLNLESNTVEVSIHGFVASITVCLQYKNPTANPLEVTYICPVDAKAAVYSLEAHLGDKVIKASCLEKKKAKEIYTEAVERGYTAVMGAENDLSGDLLHLSLGNIPPWEKAELKVKMVKELVVGSDGALEFVLPTVFNPRYCPSDMSKFAFGRPVAENPSNPLKYSMEACGQVSGSLKISQIISLSDVIEVTYDQDHLTAEIKQVGDFKADHDWSFKVYYQAVHRPSALLMMGEKANKGIMKDSVIMVNIFPEIPYESFSPHNEIIFVIDRSGSMHGSKIQKAKSTLLLFLKSLPLGCRFNIISFGSTFSSLFHNSSERYDEETLKKGLLLVQSMGADMGGTEIFEALKSVYNKDLVPGYPRQIIVVTDGEVWNQDQIFDLVSRHAHITRVFSVGIGDGASTALVQGLAENGGGRYQFVSHENQLQIKVMGLVTSMLQENVKDVKIKCKADPPEDDLSFVPKVPPVVFGGQHLILYARVKPGVQVKSLKVSWNIGNGTTEVEMKESDCKVIHDSNFSFHRLASKAQIKQWQMDDIDNFEDKLIDLSTCSNVVCKLTAFVGVDETKNIIRRKIAEQRALRSSYPCSHRGKGTMFSFGGSSGGSSLFGSSSPETEIKSFGICSAILPSPLLGGSIGPPNDAFFPRASSNPSLPPEARKCTAFMSIESESCNQFNAEVDHLMTIISSQTFDGSWDLDDALNLFPIYDVQNIKNFQAKISVDDKCFGTILVLTFLERKFSPRKEEWRLVSLKASKYLESKSLDPNLCVQKCSELLERII